MFMHNFCSSYIETNLTLYMYLVIKYPNWASEANPTLGCSIEILRDIGMYICMCVCRSPKSVGGFTWAKRAHAQSKYWAVKSEQ